MVENENVESLWKNSTLEFKNITGQMLYKWARRSVIHLLLFLLHHHSHLSARSVVVLEMGGSLSGAPSRQREVQPFCSATARQNPSETLVVGLLLVVQSFDVEEEGGHLVWKRGAAVNTQDQVQREQLVICCTSCSLRTPSPVLVPPLDRQRTESGRPSISLEEGRER